MGVRGEESFMIGGCLNVALVESYFGGSHRAFAEGLSRHSRHAVQVTALPARFWKWRMRGAALECARRLREPVLEGRVDVLLATSLIDLAHLKALLPAPVPCVLYFHENQVSYPPRPGRRTEPRDLQYAFTNVASALAADRVLFNSAFQRDAFLVDLRKTLRRMPDLRSLWAVGEIAGKTEVAPLGVELSGLGAPVARVPGAPPTVLWNHRWEYDKAPEEFFGVLEALAARGVDFRVAVAGESYSRAPAVFEEARGRLGDRVVHWGYVPDREAYERLLARSDFVVSTAIQENFGIAVVEAAYAGAHPLLPRRLSYPEVLPASLHGDCLYEGPGELAERLEALLTGRTARVAPEVLRAAMAPHAWENRAGALDDSLGQVFEERRRPSVV